jgi:PAS domain S-box-containing protein
MEFQHHDLFENLVEAFPDPIAIHCDYNLVYINKAGPDMLGSTVEALIGKSILEIVHPDSWDDSRIYIDPILREGPSTKTRNISLVGADGKIIVLPQP